MGPGMEGFISVAFPLSRHAIRANQAAEFQGRGKQGARITDASYAGMVEKGGLMNSRMNALLAVGLVVCCLASFACGADIAASAKLGTLGFGADVTMPFNEQLNWRAGLNFFTYKMSETEEPEEGDGGGSTDINAELGLFTVGAFADWHPWASRFRVTGGLVLNNNELKLTAKPGDTIDFNDREYAVNSVDGSVSFNSLCPYIGIGMGNPFAGEGRWFFTLDAGVMFHGAPKVDLSAVAANPAQQGALNADLADEKTDMQEDVNSFVVWPVLSAGVTYMF